MSERTTIGGTVYETVGSSSSNLLLKCNGTARIQWGNKLIDLIKNGKIASGDSSTPIFIISDESEIKSDGIYVIDKEKSSQLWIRKNRENYNFTDTELYISASTKQDITVDQQKQALENIGFYYNTLDDVKKSGIQNGLVYVLEDRSLYSITEGLITEFEAKLKAIAVEENKEGEIINSSVKVVLSVLDTEYLVLKDNRITAKKSIHVPKYLQLGSEDATDSFGYRLYFQGDESWLEVDNISVRNGIPTKEYIEITFDELRSLMSGNRLQPQQLYAITNYQNPWRLPANNILFNRVILVRAATSNSLYEEGYLLNDRRITIHYDPTYVVGIYCTDGTSTITRGMITWMKDENNNEANFDFLDYLDSQNTPMTTLHYDIFRTDIGKASERWVEGVKSVFPRNSKNNKVTIHNLKGTVITNGLLDETNTVTLDFKIQDSGILSDTLLAEDLEALPTMAMYNNVIDCYGLSTADTCVNFYNNELTNVGKVHFGGDCINSKLTDVYSISEEVIPESLANYVLNPVTFPFNVIHTTLDGCINSTINCVLNRCTFDVITKSTFNGDMYNSTFFNIMNCTFHASFTKVNFQNISDSTFNAGALSDINCRSDVFSITVSESSHPILYDTSKVKDVYFLNGNFQVVESAASGFVRGMIVMHTGEYPIPEGWAICDGKEHTYDGVKTKTPDLTNRFIKAVALTTSVGVGNVRNDGASNEFTLKEQHLPAHSHPHAAHTHEISGLTGTLADSGDLTFNMPDYVENMSASAALATTSEGESEVITRVSYTNGSGTVTGGNHTHTLTISGGSISQTASTEAEKTWTNKSFKIEPNYYALIFIMKL